MKHTLNDEEVIRQYLPSCPNACFETLYNRYVRKVYNRCYSLTKDSDKAQDFTHDIFMRVFDRLDRFQERSTFSTWLYSISYNYCMDQLRSASRMATTSLEDNHDYHTPEPDEADHAEHGLHVLANAMRSLSWQEAQILRLKYQDGLDVRQIAEQLNLKESAVKMRLKRSRDKVRALCADVAY